MAERVRLVVFSDDWGRHPSSCQHLVSQLVDRYPTLWVNTIGTRMPRLSLDDARKVVVKLKQWTTGSRKGEAKITLPANLRITTPLMWPGFRSNWQRSLNAKLIAKHVNQSLGPRQPDERRIAITTIPLTADLVGRLDVDRWVYYCVDDFSVWPGVDSRVMQTMEREQVGRVDACIAAGETLAQRLSDMGRQSVLLTHGIDLDHWHSRHGPSQSAPLEHSELAGGKVVSKQVSDSLVNLSRPIFLFWGLIDTRLDSDWCLKLASAGAGTLVLVGPSQAPDEKIVADDRIMKPGAAAYDELPQLAMMADVLVMPYADLPVTRAMQPLKFKEYLATGKPVVVRKLPATQSWSDAADVIDDADTFVRVVIERASQGLPASQKQARERLSQESWSNKARQFEAVLLTV